MLGGFEKPPDLLGSDCFICSLFISFVSQCSGVKILPSSGLLPSTGRTCEGPTQPSEATSIFSTVSVADGEVGLNHSLPHPFVSISLGCGNRGLQTGSTEMDSLPSGGFREGPFHISPSASLPASSGYRHSLACGHITLKPCLYCHTACGLKSLVRGTRVKMSPSAPTQTGGSRMHGSVRPGCSPISNNPLNSPPQGGAKYPVPLSALFQDFEGGSVSSPKKKMATHSSIFALRIPWSEEPGGLLSMGSHRVGHD